MPRNRIPSPLATAGATVHDHGAGIGFGAKCHRLFVAVGEPSAFLQAFRFPGGLLSGFLRLALLFGSRLRGSRLFLTPRRFDGIHDDGDREIYAHRNRQPFAERAHYGSVALAPAAVFVKGLAWSAWQRRRGVPALYTIRSVRGLMPLSGFDERPLLKSGGHLSEHRSPR